MAITSGDRLLTGTVMFSLQSIISGTAQRAEARQQENCLPCSACHVFDDADGLLGNLEGHDGPI